MRYCLNFLSGDRLYNFFTWFYKIACKNIIYIGIIFFQGMVVQAKFADSHIADKNTMKKDEDEEKVSIQGSENKSFEKNENVGQKPNQENQGLYENPVNPITENAAEMQSQEL